MSPLLYHWATLASWTQLKSLQEGKRRVANLTEQAQAKIRDWMHIKTNHNKYAYRPFRNCCTVISSKNAPPKCSVLAEAGLARARDKSAHTRCNYNRYCDQRMIKCLLAYACSTYLITVRGLKTASLQRVAMPVKNDQACIFSIE